MNQGHLFRLARPNQRAVRCLVTFLVLLAGLGLWPARAYADGPVPLDPYASWFSGDTGDTRSVAWGDVDGDGDLDLAAGNGYYVGQQNKVYLNQGGVLETTASWTSGESDATSSVAWGDVDGDGDLDLAVGNGDYYGVAQPNKVYLNQGGVLETTASWTSGESDWTESVAWGDVDGDGDLDLAVGNGYCDLAQPNKVYLNQGGVLETTASWTSGDTDDTNSVAWGDVDGDGDLDLAVGNGDCDRPQPNKVYLNQGGVLETTASWTSGDRDHTYSVAWGDVDGDGDLDLAAGNRFEESGVYLNQGGGLETTTTWGVDDEEDETKSVAWGDVDGDGDLDLAIGNERQNKVYLNQGEGLEASWTSGDWDYSTESVAWGDVDGDGDLDLATGNSFGQPNKVYLNQGGVLETTASWSGDGGGGSVAWGDVDGDGDLDLAVGNGDYYGVAQPNKVYLNQGGVLETTVSWTSGDEDDTRSVAWGDVDGDGDLDLAVGNGDDEFGQPNKVYLNQEGVLETTASWTSGDSDSTSSVAWGDVDGDGDLDLAAGNDGQPNRVYLNQGGVLETTASWTSGESDATSSVAWGDMDGDGDLDLAVGNAEEGENKVYLNQGGSLETTASWTSRDTDNTRSVAWGDVDGDGDLDLAAGNGNRNKVYLNQGGSLETTASWTSGDTDWTKSVAWGDVDGDGHLDLAAGNNAQESKVYLNQRGALETTASWISSDGAGGRVAWGDVDGDGDLDLAASSGPKVYENGRQGEQALPHNAPYLAVTRPIPTGDANFYATPVILDSPTIPITYTLFDPEGDPVRFIRAYYSPNGGGQWFPATASSGTITTNLSTRLPEHYASGNTFPITIPVTGSPLSSTLIIPGDQTVDDLDVWLDIHHTRDEDLDVYLESPNGTQVELFTDVGGSGDDFTGTILDDEATTPITAGTAPFSGRFQPEGSLAAFEGQTVQGIWTLWVTDDEPAAEDGALTSWGLNLQAGDGTHVFTWQAEADVIKSDNVAFRIKAYQGFTGPGPYQWPYASAQTFPFRVAAPWFIRVVDEGGNPVAGVPVYADGQPITQTVTGASVTDQAGLLNPGPLAVGTSLAALAPQATVTTTRAAHDGWAYRTHLTTQPLTVSGPGEQRLLARRDAPLVLFNLVVSIEWDATDDYVDEIARAVQHASDYLYDLSDGQMAFGQVAIYDNGEFWAEADIQISTKNIVRPHAYIGGITSDDKSHVIRVGRGWDGNSGNQGPWDAQDGYRTLAHEFGHYALHLYDEYFAYLFDQNDNLSGEVPAYCTGPENRNPATQATNASVMDYQYTSSELSARGVPGLWSPLCEQTAQWQMNGESPWETLTRMYSDTVSPPRWQFTTPISRGSVLSGPTGLPAELPALPVVTINNSGASGPPRHLTVRDPDGECYWGTIVALYKQDGRVIGQGFSNGNGHLDVYGAGVGDILRAASMDGGLAGSVTVGTETDITLTLAPVGGLAAQATGGIPHIRVVAEPSQDPSQIDLLLFLQNFGSGADPDVTVTEPSSGMSYSPTTWNYSPTTDTYEGQISFSASKQGMWRIRARAEVGNSLVRLQSTYRLQRVLDSQSHDVYSDDGNLSLHLEPGSLPGSEAYFAVMPPGALPGPLPEGVVLVGDPYDVTASGALATLEKPAVLKLRYDGALVTSSSAPEGLGIYRWDPNSGAWQAVPGNLDEEQRAMVVPVTALGTYALLALPGEWEPSNDIFLPIILKAMSG